MCIRTCLRLRQPLIHLNMQSAISSCWILVVTEFNIRRCDPNRRLSQESSGRMTELPVWELLHDFTIRLCAQLRFKNGTRSKATHACLPSSIWRWQMPEFSVGTASIIMNSGVPSSEFGKETTIPTNSLPAIQIGFRWEHQPPMVPATE